MKNRDLLIIALVGALLVAYYMLGTDYLKQRRAGRELAAKIADTSLLLSQTPRYPADLKDWQAAAQAGLDAVKNSFPQNLDSTRIIDSILEIAGETGVKAIPLVTQPWTVVSIDDFPYSVLRLNVTATGTYAQVSGFLERLETSEMETLVIEEISVDRADEPPGEESVSGATAEFNADLNLAFYSRPSAD